ncbi:MAG: transposase [Planctomycetaceae bacterium]|nr:transposase [Planctomycetaceae bacterium]
MYSYDNVLVCKVLVLKYFYNLSDEQTELQIRDRLSFQHFLGLTRADKIPDARTIWLFGEELHCANVERKLFERFQEALAGKGLIAKASSIVDGTFVEVPKQRNRREENAQIKRGGIPESLKSAQKIPQRR